MMNFDEEREHREQVNKTGIMQFAEAVQTLEGLTVADCVTKERGNDTDSKERKD